MRIGIVGCGTAGPAAGTLLARAGHEVTLLERVSTPGPVGAGLLIQPVGQAVLRRLGVLEELGHSAAPVHRLLGSERSGRKVLDLRYAELRPDLVGMGVSRASLSKVLLDAARRAGVSMLFGQACASVSPTPDGLHVLVATDQAISHGPFDLVVIADGARSGLRPPPLVRRDARYGWGALWFTCTKPDPSYDGALEQTYEGCKQMVGFLPIGNEQVAVFWSLPLDTAAELRARPIGEWKAAVGRLSRRAAPLVEQVATWGEVALAQYADTVLRRWHDGRVVWIGDAGHSMSPQLGMGANLALSDAAVLADCLTREPLVHRALDSYSAARGPTIRYYQAVSRLLTPWFQSDQAWRAPVRNLGLPLARAVWPLRREMLRGLVGTKRGWWGATPLPESSALWVGR